MALVTISFCIAFTSQPDADEFCGQPVQQFRVRRPLTLQAEIFSGLDQAGAEIHLPEDG